MAHKIHPTNIPGWLCIKIPAGNRTKILIPQGHYILARKTTFRTGLMRKWNEKLYEAWVEEARTRERKRQEGKKEWGGLYVFTEHTQVRSLLLFLGSSCFPFKEMSLVPETLLLGLLLHSVSEPLQEQMLLWNIALTPHAFKTSFIQ